MPTMRLDQRRLTRNIILSGQGRCMRKSTILNTSRLLACLLLGTTVFLSVGSVGSAAQDVAPSQYPGLPSEMPAKIQSATDSFDYSRREVMIPMRDGVKLHTVILVPKNAKGAPILLTRTPYDANKLTTHIDSSHLEIGRAHV